MDNKTNVEQTVYSKKQLQHKDVVKVINDIKGLVKTTDQLTYLKNINKFKKVNREVLISINSKDKIFTLVSRNKNNFTLKENLQKQFGLNIHDFILTSLRTRYNSTSPIIRYLTSNLDDSVIINHKTLSNNICIVKLSNTIEIGYDYKTGDIVSFSKDAPEFDTSNVTNTDNIPEEPRNISNDTVSEQDIPEEDYRYLHKHYSLYKLYLDNKGVEVVNIHLYFDYKVITFSHNIKATVNINTEEIIAIEKVNTNDS